MIALYKGLELLKKEEDAAGSDDVKVEKIMKIKASNPGNIMAQAFDKNYYDSLTPELKKRLVTCCISGIENPDS
jgi:hypothetical protein